MTEPTHERLARYGWALSLLLSGGCGGDDDAALIRHVEALERHVVALEKQNTELKKIRLAQADALKDQRIALEAMWQRLESIDQSLKVSVYGSIYGRGERR